MHLNIQYSSYFFYSIQFQATAKRCHLDRSQCESFSTWILPDICKVLNQKNQIWTDLMASTQPKIRCPINSPVVKFRNATVDYSLIAHLPMDGFTWIINLKVFKPIVNIRHKKRLIFCVMIEVTVMNSQQLEKSKRRNTKELSSQREVKSENCSLPNN